MSAWSDWKCGALTDDEYAAACDWEYAGDNEEPYYDDDDEEGDFDE